MSGLGITGATNNPINISVICQKYSNFNITNPNNVVVTLVTKPISNNTFKYIFYEGDNFNINPVAGTSPSLIPYVSILPEYCTKFNSSGGTGSFSLFNEIMTTITESLNITQDSIDPVSLIILSKEINSITSLCNLHQQSMVNSLKWSDINNIIINDPSYDSGLPLIMQITLIFVSSTQNVNDLVVLVRYSIDDFFV